ncbi:conserved hypothetical protein, partial [Trichinella spiralis]|uniref:hypothetical protein n=1 Tax=Trichinella spiralis TaxID=6334 RepID=UPI0001EFC877
MRAEFSVHPLQKPFSCTRIYCFYYVLPISRSIEMPTIIPIFTVSLYAYIIKIQFLQLEIEPKIEQTSKSSKQANRADKHLNMINNLNVALQFHK